MQKSIDIFLGYATEDKELCLEVMKQLKSLVREGLIRLWHEYTIIPGVEREREILHYLELAQIILLFISVDFINSDFCYSIELKRAMERHGSGEVRVIPIILRPVYWQETPLGKLQALPRGHKPIKNWPDRDTILNEIGEEIRLITKELVSERYLQESRYFIEQKHYKRAIEDCEHALRLVPDSVRAYRLKGFALLELERYEEALIAYDYTIRLGLNTASVYKEQGDVLFHLQRYSEALTSYEEAIALRPHFVPAYKGAGEALRQLAKKHHRQAEIYDEKVQALSHSEGNSAQEGFLWDL